MIAMLRRRLMGGKKPKEYTLTVKWNSDPVNWFKVICDGIQYGYRDGNKTIKITEGSTLAISANPVSHIHYIYFNNQLVKMYDADDVKSYTWYFPYAITGDITFTFRREFSTQYSYINWKM